jgi:TPR repeat protein
MGTACSCNCGKGGYVIDNANHANSTRSIVEDFDPMTTYKMRDIMFKSPLLQDDDQSPENPSDAFLQLVHQASSDGADGEAMFKLGFCYEKGTEVKQDFKLARSWYEKSAEKINTKSMLRLGKMYQKGRGVEVDLQKALFWYKEAAVQPEGDGCTEAQYRVGWFYEQGVAVEQSFAEAFVWFKRAAEARKKPNQDAVYKVGSFYFDGKGVVAPDEVEAVRWFKRSAVEFSDPRAMYRLASCYETGTGIEKDAEQAREWFKDAFHEYKKAAENEENPDRNATFELAVFYLEGTVVPKNYDAAFSWFSKSAIDFRDPRGMYRIGYCYELGLGVESNLKRAAEWYNEAAKFENPSALKRLAGFYEKGKFFQQDLEKAEKLKKMAEDIRERREDEERRKRLTQLSEDLDDEIVTMKSG